ncbi:tRNA nucleotidyltransferase cca2 isoform X2 [Magnolia sinica]|uniref:tRNA nucleotidyltransferase cca2 isoform X2 n=1 Tax=Magnolia sinica TaxID=86752 RepID=UPI002659D8AD|nr:tRNA nucleotidyltransferase cca2 isoform X2 [Magnolia sinica]
MAALPLTSPRLLVSLQRFPFPPLDLPFFPQPKFPTFLPNQRLGFLRVVCCRSMAQSSTAVHVKEKIDLTDKEKKIFGLLVDALQHSQLKTQLRVAGGWVRDKLLGKECYDIDIAVDDMLGREFCEKVNEYLSYTGEEEHSISVIQSNPDQSKHLETARMRIFDTWIDFANLRSETYAENSRIPTMKFGTAEEDAYRRDLTINSLFYNINTDSVEDLTGRGLEDLRYGMIVTPLPPKATFLDDPLRVLRAIRFGARFGFVLDEELKKAASDAEVKAALADKISRERIGHEIDLMMSGNHPVKAMAYICDLHLFWVVFCLPDDSEPAVVDGSDRLCVAYMDAAWKILEALGCSMLSDDQRRLYLYGALLLPLRKSVYTNRKAKKVISLHSASERFICLSLIASSDDSEVVKTDLEEESMDVPLSSRRRILAGLLLRQIKDFWRAALLISTLLYPDVDDAEKFLAQHFELDQRREWFKRVENSIMELDLDNVWKVKPLLDGNAIINALQVKQAGPEVGEWHKKVLKWQLAYPSGNADECIDWIRQSQAKRAKLE